MRRRLLALLLALALSGCAYFNSLYNANRSFDAAERAHARGNVPAARRAYAESIEKAATSYRKYPNSRWADDALLLIMRAHFALEQDRAAAAAATRLLELTSDAQMRATAHAVLGAALFRSGAAPSATAHLDSAVALARPRSDADALARLWRARAAFREGRFDAAWDDLERASVHDHVATDATMEAATYAAQTHDSTRLATAFARLARIRYTAASADSLIAVLDRAAATWSPAAVLHSSAALEHAAWPDDIGAAVALARARLALAAGDAPAALRIATRLAASAGQGTGSTARLLAARIRLTQLDDAAGLVQIRELLLPAFDNADALALMRHVKATQLLVLRGLAGSGLSLFAAAEHARDDLGAPLLARRLFMEFATREANEMWAGKALLAAHLLAADAESGAALARAANNVYIRAAHGDRAADITAAEERLARGLVGLRAEALQEAVLRDVIVGRAVSLLDSTRAAARFDSVRIACGTLVDSLQLRGVRADSVRSACLRGDSVRVGLILRLDTLKLRDTTDVRLDPLPPR